MQAADLAAASQCHTGNLFTRAIERLEALDPGLEAISVVDEGENEEDDGA
jgi:hypothetical protein